MLGAAAARERDAGSLPASADGGARRLGARRIYILPTRHGLLYAAMLVLMLIGSINYGNSLGYVLTFLLAGLYLVCTLHTQRNLLGLRVAAGRAVPVHAGDVAGFELLLDNSAGPARYAVGISAAPPRQARRLRRPAQSQPPAPTLVDVEAGGQAIVQLPLPAPRRGWLRLPPVIVESRFPLGLFRAWSVADIDLRCLVYPAPSGAAPLPLPAADGQAGAVSRLHGAEDFAGFRVYRPGDSPRYIAWKAVARGQPLLVKRFSGGAAGALWLDYSSLAHLPDTERRLAQLCRWVLDAEAAGLRYGLRLPGREIGQGSGEAQRAAALKALALWGLES